eukprot:Gb_29405 [translate_table: standard]
MANCYAGFYNYQPSKLHLKSAVCASLCFPRPYWIGNAVFHKKRTSNSVRKNEFLWYRAVSRRVVTCNFFGQTVEADKDEDKNEENKELELEDDRPPFDLNVAVVLAGFAFEAYVSPPAKAGVRETDASECETVFLSEQFLHAVYDGQLFIKLKKGMNLPTMDPWGTSDPYVVMQLGDCVAKSKIIWASKEPNWNESFTINMKNPSTKYLQVAAWDANLVTPHKRMGNAGIKLESLCDGNMHDIQVELEGIGGGGLISLEVKYKTFEEINAEKGGWRIPFFSDMLLAKGLENALKTAFGTESVKAREFVRSAFGQIQPLVDTSKFEKNQELEGDSLDKLPSGSTLNGTYEKGSNEVHGEQTIENKLSSHQAEFNKDRVGDEMNLGKEECLSSLSEASNDQSDNSDTDKDTVADRGINSEFNFWKNLAESINQTVEGFGVNKVGFPALENVRWDANEMIKKLGLQSQTKAEEQYVETGLATPKKGTVDEYPVQSPQIQEAHSTPMDIKQASRDVLRQTDSILGSLMMLTAPLTGQRKDSSMEDRKEGRVNTTAIVMERCSESSNSGKDVMTSEAAALANGSIEEMKNMFATAESAMEAWAMLATALGRASFIKSEFEKICFLDNPRTDTQVAIWRDAQRQRLVIAFRGTEQARWKDLRTDLMLLPTGLNPERVGGDFKEEVQVHSGFLSAYDSVRNRLLSFIKSSICFVEGEKDKMSTWHIYVTGHSLGGALATLLALELSSSQMAQCGCIIVTMYNFGSPRVGNKRFAEVYNQKVKNSWRIVNHRDIIPTVPRLMGYYHVAQPIYLTAGDLHDASVEMELMEDGYQRDFIGESTPDALVSEFMKGEKQLIDKLLQTEINLFRTIRDGSALMQHMEDFYYITLLESIRSRYLLK